VALGLHKIKPRSPGLMMEKERTAVKETLEPLTAGEKEKAKTWHSQDF